MVSEHLSIKQKKLLRQHKYILQKLSSASDKDKRVILENAPPELFQALRMLYKLLVNKELNLTKSQEKKLIAHRQLIHSIDGLKETELQKKLIRYRRQVTSILRIILPAFQQG